VPENVSIAYRGAQYAIGQGPRFYGIWHAAAPQAQPLEWWPLTPEGWTGAWSRFASIEVPGTIAAVTGPGAAVSPASGPAVPAGPVITPSAGATAELAAGQAAAGGPVSSLAPAGQASAEAIDPAYGQVDESVARPARMTLRTRIGAGLLGLGVVLGIVGLFPVYVAGASLASVSADLVPHLIYLAAWAVSAALILLSGTWRRAGAMLGLGVSAVTFGLFFADAGTPMADGAHLMGAGLIISILGWLACSAGAVLAVTGSGLSFRRRSASRRGPGGGPARPSQHEIVPAVTMILAAIGAAIAFAPSWDSFLLTTTTGVSQTVTEGNAFANSAPVIIGDVLVMVLLVAVVIVAALWRPIRLGAALAIGALVPMVAQAISAIVQVGQVTSPLQFGVSQAQARALGLTIHNGLTPMFWVFCAFVGILILLCVWMLIAHDPAPETAGGYPAQPYYWAGPAGYPAPGVPQAGHGGPAAPQ